MAEGAVQAWLTAQAETKESLEKLREARPAPLVIEAPGGEGGVRCDVDDSGNAVLIIYGRNVAIPPADCPHVMAWLRSGYGEPPEPPPAIDPPATDPPATTE